MEFSKDEAELIVLGMLALENHPCITFFERVAAVKRLKRKVQRYTPRIK